MFLKRPPGSTACFKSYMAQWNLTNCVMYLSCFIFCGIVVSLPSWVGGHSWKASLIPVSWFSDTWWHGDMNTLSALYKDSHFLKFINLEMCLCVLFRDLSMMYRALWDRRHEGATRISQCTRRVAPSALTNPSGPWVPPISQCTIHHA